MYGVVLAVHLLVCLALMGVILIQSGKGGGLAGGAFGGATQTVFGGRGATDFITKATIYLGIIFFVTSVALAKMSSMSGGGGKSVMQETNRKATATQQQVPGRAPASVPAPTGAAGAPSTGAK